MENYTSSALLGLGEFKCSCGKTHKASLKTSVVEKGAISRLPGFVKDFGAKKAYILADENTFAAAGDKVVEELKNAGIEYKLCLYGKERIEPDEQALGKAVLHFDGSCGVIISVGSGVLNDAGKIIAGMTKLPYICVATAPSMDGYASSTSSVIRDKLKVSVNSKCPDVVIGDVDVLKNAPKIMLLAGLGDMLAKYVSVCEWRIGHIVTGEYYCEEVADVIRHALKACVEGAKGLLLGDENAVKAVMDGLIVSGIAADWAGVSRPVSGTEHYFSHIWDMRAAVLGTPSSLHGIQCAIGTLETLKGYEALKRLLKKGFGEEDFNKNEWLEELSAYMGDAGAEMLKNAGTCDLYNETKREERKRSIKENAEEIIDIINSELPSYNELYELLVSLGAPLSPEDIGISKEETAVCFKATKDIRDKYILSSLALDLGRLDEIANIIQNNVNGGILMKKIIIAGAGHGGLVAAAILAKEGYDVTVYEKKQEDELGYDQYDSVHLDGFELSGVPVPEEYKVKRTGITFVIPGTDIPPLSQGVSDDTYNVEIDRKALYRYLIAPAKEAGVEFRFGCEVKAPIMLGSRVCGLVTGDGEVYADLVIDACGIYSPVRTALPAALGIQKDVAGFDVMRTYRAFYTRDPEAGEPQYKYIVSLIPGDFCGIVWAITNDTEVDILIASMTHDLTDEDIAEKTELLKKTNPVIGEFIRGGRVADIPVRQPLAMLVADGYAAIGDSAFMTIPLKGSGIGHSMRAGKLLAEAVIDDKNGFYTRETLWKYQTEFFDQIGFSSALIAVIKGELPYISQEDLEYFFQNIISPELLESFGNEAKFTKIISSFGFKELRDKAKKVVGHQSVRSMLVRGGKNITRALMLRQSLKDKYDSKSAAKWIATYNGFFDGISVDASGDNKDAQES